MFKICCTKSFNFSFMSSNMSKIIYVGGGVCYFRERWARSLNIFVKIRQRHDPKINCAWFKTCSEFKTFQALKPNDIKDTVWYTMNDEKVKNYG